MPTNSEFELIGDAWDLLHERYVDRADLDSRQLAYGAIDGLTTAVGDTGHTSFETPQELKAEQDSLNGKYVGIGALVGTENDVPTIEGVFPNSPAAEANLREGDQIVAVDGTPTAGMAVDEVTAKVRGPEGTSVTLTIRRQDSTVERRVTLTRRSVELPVVEWSMIPGTTIADVKIDQFSAGATDKLEAAITGAKGDSATGLIVDMRNNPGGRVDEAVGVASQFLSGGVVYQQEDADGNKTPVEVKPGGLATDLPLVVLVDGETASASEIVAGALQDADRATIVGETTFGTGTVLSQFNLPDGSALRIGTIQWLTPDGHEIWHHGITPDVKADLPADVTPLTPADIEKLSAAQVKSSTDAQLLAAIKQLQAK